MQEYTLFDKEGNRKYLTLEERTRFYKAIPKALRREQRPFALLLYWSGCRISEGLAVQIQHIDYSAKGVRFKTLKRRREVYRLVPLPPTYMEKLDDVYNIKSIQRQDKKAQKSLIWNHGRQWGWETIKKVMKEADIQGVQATAKGLRHSFVIAHQQNKTPAHMIQKWAGWSTAAMLEVYGAAMGEEERELAATIWNQ